MTHHLNELIIDIQGLAGPDGLFIPKEIAILPVIGRHIGHWIIGPPLPKSALSTKVCRRNFWLTTFYHRLDWCQGTTPFESLKSLLFEATTNTVLIYVRGEEKKISYKQLFQDLLLTWKNIARNFTRYL